MTCTCECHEPGAIVFHVIPCCDECYQVRVGPMTDDARDAIRETMLGPYVGMPCRVCGVALTRSDVWDDRAVHAGSSADGRTSAAHRDCWERHVAGALAASLVHP